MQRRRLNTNCLLGHKAQRPGQVLAAPMGLYPPTPTPFALLHWRIDSSSRSKPAEHAAAHMATKHSAQCTHLF